MSKTTQQDFSSGSIFPDVHRDIYGDGTCEEGGDGVGRKRLGGIKVLQKLSCTNLLVRQVHLNSHRKLLDGNNLKRRNKICNECISFSFPAFQFFFLWIFLQTIVLYPPPSLYTCTARVWLREIGFSLTYGALMLKTWR